MSAHLESLRRQAKDIINEENAIREHKRKLALFKYQFVQFAVNAGRLDLLQINMGAVRRAGIRDMGLK